MIGGRTRDCYGWGQPVHAAFGGTVARAVDGVPERHWVHAVRQSCATLKNLLLFRVARRRFDPVRLAGNHVIIGAGRTYALYAHLGARERRGAQGAAGPRPAGDRAGRPYRQLDRPAPAFPADGLGGPADARGIPCAIAEYLIRRGGQWERVLGGIPGRLERICSVS